MLLKKSVVKIFDQFFSAETKIALSQTLINLFWNKCLETGPDPKRFQSIVKSANYLTLFCFKDALLQGNHPSFGKIKHTIFDSHQQRRDFQ